MGFIKKYIKRSYLAVLLCVNLWLLPKQIIAQDYPSTFGYSVLIGSKNTSRIGLDPVEQQSFGSYGAGVFWDCYQGEKFHF